MNSTPMLLKNQLIVRMSKYGDRICHACYVLGVKCASADNDNGIIHVEHRSTCCNAACPIFMHVQNTVTVLCFIAGV